MPKKKTQPRKKKAKKKTTKKRSQKVNRLKYVEPEVLFELQKESGAPSKKKVICFNMECKLRRAGCYGYEACPGFKT
jgi:hypothetical protein